MVEHTSHKRTGIGQALSEPTLLALNPCARQLRAKNNRRCKGFLSKQKQNMKQQVLCPYVFSI